jgi:hypothetical protein
VLTDITEEYEMIDFFALTRPNVPRIFSRSKRWNSPAKGPASPSRSSALFNEFDRPFARGRHAGP